MISKELLIKTIYEFEALDFDYEGLLKKPYENETGDKLSNAIKEDLKELTVDDTFTDEVWQVLAYYGSKIALDRGYEPLISKETQHKEQEIETSETKYAGYTIQELKGMTTFALKKFAKERYGIVLNRTASKDEIIEGICNGTEIEVTDKEEVYTPPKKVKKSYQRVTKKRGRIECIVDAIKEASANDETNVEEVIKQADASYASGGGKSNIAQTTHAFNTALKYLALADTEIIEKAQSLQNDFSFQNLK